MKHGFVQEMEGILDNETKITHEDLAKKVQHLWISLSLAMLSGQHTFLPW
jgi:hypothetical protein